MYAKPDCDLHQVTWSQRNTARTKPRKCCMYAKPDCDLHQVVRPQRNTAGTKPGKCCKYAKPDCNLHQVIWSLRDTADTKQGKCCQARLWPQAGDLCKDTASTKQEECCQARLWCLVDDLTAKDTVSTKQGKCCQARLWRPVGHSISLTSFYHFINPLGKFRTPYLGKATAATRAALPIPNSTCSILLCPDKGMAVNARDLLHAHWC